MIRRFPLENLGQGLGFVLELPVFLHRPVTRRAAERCVRARLENRQARFVGMIERDVFGDRQSPYRALLRSAGCERGDIEKLAREEGVEGALEALYRKGVYLTVDEWKGRTPVQRGSLSLSCRPEQFQRRTAPGLLRIATSGSRGPGTVVPIDFRFVRSRSVNLRLDLTARDGLGWRHGIWGIPAGSALVHLLEFAGAGARPDRWFSHLDPSRSDLHPRYWWGARALRILSRLFGAPLPPLVHATVDRPEPVLDWMAGCLAAGTTPHLLAYSSAAVRLCQAAARSGRSLRGARFTVTGEPVTRARLDAIRQAGGEAVPRYGSAETGTLGFGCLAPEAPDEVHLLTDRIAVVRDDAGSAVRAVRAVSAGPLFVTALHPAAPFVLLNVSMGDVGVLGARRCGCPLERYGWTTHLHGVRSEEKLTALGMSFLDADLIRVVEELLPARFGGGPTDYQLVEEERDDGRPLLRLLVNPAVGPLDDRAVAAVFLEAIANGTGVERMMQALWRESGLIAVERRSPFATRSGKILHLHAH